jgi:type I restriction enzyme S subunit
MGLRHLQKYFFYNLFVCWPRKEEQIKVADFLDKKTAEIGELMEKDKKLIELLKEKRIALINHAVTKGLPVLCTQTGLDPNAKMKDSGIEWIGKIPEGWEVYKLKYKTIINKKKLEDDINPNYIINYLDISKGVIGAIQTAGTAYNTFKGADLRSIVNEEANLAFKDILRNSIPAAVRQQPGGDGGFVFPRSPGQS